MIISKNGSEIFSFELNPLTSSEKWNKWKFKVKSDFFLGLTGIYLISFGSGDRKHLVYAGSYAGNRNAFERSDVAKDRWLKHLCTVTLLDNAAKCSSKKLFEEVKRKALANGYAEFPLFDPNWDTEDQSTFFKKSNGCNISKNRLSFAVQNWKQLYKLADSGRLLDSFHFHFICAKPDRQHTKDALSAELKAIESRTIEEFASRLPINKEYKPERSQCDFHYSTNSLLEDGAPKFESLAQRIDSVVTRACRSSGYRED